MPLYRTRARMSKCVSCSSKIGLLEWKRYCTLCNCLFCSSCLPKEKGVVKRKCASCKIMCTNPLRRSVVNDLRIIDLKWFLKCKSVSIMSCTEKSELVDLVMQHAPFAELVTRPVIPLPPATASSSIPPPPASFDSLPSNDIPPVVASSAMHMGLENISSEEEIAQLTVGHLKLILVRNFVDFKGCFEKRELQDRVLRLWREKQLNKQKNDDHSKSEVESDDNICKICWEAQIDCVMLECGHMATCTTCGKQMNECPICRQYVVRVVHIFKA